MNLFARLAARFEAASDRPALRGTNLLTYGGLLERTQRFAAALRHLVVEPGDRVLVQVEKSAHAVALYLACLQTGAIFLPVNPSYTTRDLDWLVEDAEPRLVVCDPAFTDRYFRSVETLAADGEGTLAAVASEQMPLEEVCESPGGACLLYTSGTTGRSKGALLSHENLLHNAEALRDAWGWRTDDVLLHALPIFHIHGLFVALNCALLDACEIIFLPRFSPRAVMDALPSATVFMGVPTYYTRLLAHPELTRDMAEGMRLFTCGSAPLLPQTFEVFEQRSGHRIVERYGMTETGIITSNRVEIGGRLGTVGLPLRGTHVVIRDEGGRQLPPGEVGVLHVRSQSVTSGYWRNPGATGDALGEDGFFRTGDLASMNEEGFVTLVGRSSDLIISGGLNVYPKDIEMCLDALDGVVESAVFGVPHSDFGEAVVAAVVLERGTDLQHIAAAAAPDLADFKRPKRFEIVEALPRNAMGKVQKSELRKRFARLFE